jgi:hypothetical protein
VRKHPTKSAPADAVFIALGLSPDLRDSLKLLSARRKARSSPAGGKPAFINGIVDMAIAKLAVALKSGAPVSFIPVPRVNSGRTSFRISPLSHRVAVKASEKADVKLSDYVRTAISLYVRSHAREIGEEAKTPGRRKRKPSKR